EGLTMAGLALGALLVPALVHLGGNRLALLGIAAVLPLAAMAGGRKLFGLDAGTPVPVVEIALLRSLPLFAELPAPAMQGLAAALARAEVPAGAVLIRQGDPGDAYYAIAAGELDVMQDGRFLRRCGRGDGVGEIALLRAVPRTATVTAHTAATVYRLGRELFLTEGLGHAATRRQAARIADARLAADAAPGGDPPPGRTRPAGAAAAARPGGRLRRGGGGGGFGEAAGLLGPRGRAGAVTYGALAATARSWCPPWRGWPGARGRPGRSPRPRARGTPAGNRRAMAG